MVLNRNPDNFSLKTNRRHFIRDISFPALIFTNDPLPGRLFSLYTDTQISRLAAKPMKFRLTALLALYHNFQRDGMHRMDIDTNPANYEPNSINDNWLRRNAASAKTWRLRIIP